MRSPEQPREIRALVFDFDGVILDTESALIMAAEAVHHAHGMPFDRSALLHAAGTVFTQDEWSAFPLRYSRAQLKAELERACTAAFERLPVLPGVLEWIEEADRRGLALGIASNSHHRYIEDHLQRLGLRPYFAAVSGRDDVANPKPEPDVYLRTAALLGVRPGEALAIEDSATGARSAHAAGLCVLGVPSPSTADHDLSAAHLRAASLADLGLDAALRHFAGASTRGG